MLSNQKARELARRVLKKEGPILGILEAQGLSIEKLQVPI